MTMLNFNLSTQMLPTDRWEWSTKDGTKPTPKESFVLPEHWHWESDWYIDHTVTGDVKVLPAKNATDLLQVVN